MNVCAELEQAAALKYLHSWLQHHPKYGTIAPPEQANSLYYADVSFKSYLNLKFVIPVEHS